MLLLGPDAYFFGRQPIVPIDQFSHRLLPAFFTNMPFECACSSPQNRNSFFISFSAVTGMSSFSYCRTLATIVFARVISLFTHCEYDELVFRFSMIVRK